MHPFLTEKKSAYDAVIDHVLKELGSLRTGRASPAMVEDIRVMAYDAPMDLKSVASISVPDAHTLAISPWDKSLLQSIEKAIRDADIGLSPAVDGSVIRLTMPHMTEESRRKLVKHMKEKLEEARVSLRQVREEARDLISRREKEKGIGEDEKFKVFEELDKCTKEYVQRVDDMGKKKEEEIMTI